MQMVIPAGEGKGWDWGEVPNCDDVDPLEFPNESKLAKSVFELLCAAVVTNMRQKTTDENRMDKKMRKNNTQKTET